MFVKYLFVKTLFFLLLSLRKPIDICFVIAYNKVKQKRKGNITMTNINAYLKSIAETQGKEKARAKDAELFALYNNDRNAFLSFCEANSIDLKAESKWTTEDDNGKMYVRTELEIWVEDEPEEY